MFIPYKTNKWEEIVGRKGYIYMVPFITTYIMIKIVFSGAADLLFLLYMQF